MSVLAKVAVFSGFVLAYLAVLMLAARLHPVLARPSEAGFLRSFLATEVVILLNVIVLFGSVWVLSSFFDLTLVIVYFAALQLTAILRPILTSALTSPKLPWDSRSFIFGFEIGMKYPRAVRASQVLIIIAAIAYPIACAFVYFGHDVPSDYVTKRVFQFYLICFFVVYGLTGMPLSVSILFSKNTDNDSRLRLLINQLAGLAPMTLSLALIFWSFGINAEQSRVIFTRDTLAISPLLLLVLIGYACCIAIFPYIVGSLRAKVWWKELIHKQQDWISKLVDILRTPIPMAYAANLEQLSNHIEQAKAQFTARDEYLALIFDDARRENLTKDERMAKAFSDLEKSKHLDPRFRYISFLEKVQQYIIECNQELTNLTDERERIKRAQDFASAYRDRLNEAAEMKGTETQAALPLGAGVAFIATALVTTVIGEVGKELVSLLSEAMK